MSVQAFEEMQKLIENYRLETIAQSLLPETEVVVKPIDHEIKEILDEFFAIVKEFIKRKDYFSASKGTLGWLDWIYRALGLESKLIKTIGDKAYSSYDDEEIRWIVGFGVNAMLEIIQRVQKWLRKEASLFKVGRRDHVSLRQLVICVLGNLTFSLFSITFAIIRIEKKEIEPQELYDAVSLSLQTIKHLD